MRKDLRKFKDHTEVSKDSMINSLKEFEKWFKNKFGLNTYLIYGTLLGAARERNLIDNDDDIDIAYLSKYNKFEDVFKEMVDINIAMTELQLALDYGQSRRHPKLCGHSHFYSLDKKYAFDTWTSWIGEDGKYYFYVAGIGTDKSLLLPFGKLKLRGQEFLAPHKYKVLLRQLYGKSWVTPSNSKVRNFNNTFWRPLSELYKEKYIEKKDGEDFYHRNSNW